MHVCMMRACMINRSDENTIDTQYYYLQWRDVLSIATLYQSG